jgi:hypothetical protein
LRRLARDDSGQALAMGVFLLLLLALGMYMVATFGKHVKEKQHVQTTADALAISLATLEAESFNYIAFANRAQAAHYVTLLNLQGYVSFFSSMEHTVLVSVAICNSAAKICQAVELAGYTCGIPSATLAQAADRLFDLYRNVLRPSVDTLDQALGSTLTSRLEDLNKTLWITEMIVASVVDAHLATGGRELFHSITRDNDPSWSATTAGLAINEVLALRNHTAYLKAFDGVGGAPFKGSALDPSAYDSSDRDVQRAQRIMTEIVNATRYDRSLTARTIPFADKLGIAGLLDALRGLQKVPFLGSLLGRFGGESKLVGVQPPSDEVKIETIFRSASNDSKLTRGQFAASEDEWLWGRGSVWVKAANGGSAFRHCRAEKVETKPINPVKLGAHGVEPGLYNCETSRTNDANHDYRGISPFMLYNAGLDKSPGQRGEAFRQPDVYVWLQKSQAQVGFEKTVAFTWKTKKGEESIDTTIARSSGAFGIAELKGVHAFARAQAYYHRPGNWEEPPNLFNPYWRARLAPVVEGPSLSSGDLFDNLGDFAAANMVFH